MTAPATGLDEVADDHDDHDDRDASRGAQPEKPGRDPEILAGDGAALAGASDGKPALIVSRIWWLFMASPLRAS
jgi:hypothetical protein